MILTKIERQEFKRGKFCKNYGGVRELCNGGFWGWSVGKQIF